MKADQIRLWRWEHQLTQEQLAAQLHVHIVTLKRWEGGSQPSPGYLRLALERLDQLLQPSRLPEEIDQCLDTA